MQVYILLGVMLHEGTDVIGVYDSMLKAVTAQNQYKADPSKEIDYDAYRIQQHLIR